MIVQYYKWFLTISPSIPKWLSWPLEFFLFQNVCLEHKTSGGETIILARREYIYQNTYIYENGNHLMVMEQWLYHDP